MHRTFESCPAHCQIVEKFQIMFPNLSLPHIDSSISIFDTLNVLKTFTQDMIKNIPRPSMH